MKPAHLQDHARSPGHELLVLVEILVVRLSVHVAREARRRMLAHESTNDPGNRTVSEYPAGP